MTSRITDATPVPAVPLVARLPSTESPTPDPEQVAESDPPIASKEAARFTVRFRSQAVPMAEAPPALDPKLENGQAEPPESAEVKTRFARRGVDRIQPMESSEQRRHASYAPVRQTSNGDERSEFISFLRNATRSEEQWAAVASVTHVRPITLDQVPDGATEQTSLANAEEPGTTADDPDAVHIAGADEAGEESPAVDLNADGLKSIREVTLDIRPKEGELPDDLAAAKFLDAGEIRHPAGTNRPWPLYEFWWEAPAVCHRPLYFEEVNLERYGYSHGMIQPLLSGAHFFGTVPALPYLMTAEPHRECVYTLGHYRPGSYAPYRIHHPPVSLRAAAVEAAVVAGLIFVMP